MLLAEGGLCCLAVQTEHPLLEIRSLKWKKDNMSLNYALSCIAFFNLAIYKCDSPLFLLPLSVTQRRMCEKLWFPLRKRVSILWFQLKAVFTLWSVNSYRQLLSLGIILCYFLSAWDEYSSSANMCWKAVPFLVGQLQKEIQQTLLGLDFPFLSQKLKYSWFPSHLEQDQISKYPNPPWNSLMSFSRASAVTSCYDKSH